MCRYGFATYKDHFVCFRCRKQFKRESGTSFERKRAEDIQLDPRCPDCRNTMADVGLDFRPPRRLDVRSWRRLERIHWMGHAWKTCGCNGPGFIPTDAVGFGEYAEAQRGSEHNAERRRSVNVLFACGIIRLGRPNAEAVFAD